MAIATTPALPLRPPAHQVSPRAVRWWQLRGLLTLVVLVAPQVVVLLVLGSGAPGWLVWTAAATGVVALVYTILVPPLLYRIHRWEVTPLAVYTQAGWVTQERRIAPLSRIQTVDSERGPLEQLFGLANVRVTTASAAGPLHIKGLDAGTAQRLVHELTTATAAAEDDAT